MFQRILVPIDGSNSCERALAHATRIAKADGGLLRLVHIFTGRMQDYAVVAGQFPSDLLATMRSVAEALLNQACSYVTAQRVAVEHALIDSIGDSAHESIVAEAKVWRANLIVMGAHNQRGMQRPLGTEAGAVLRKAPIPVLLVRSGSAAAHQPIVLPSGAALRLVAAH